MLKQKSYFHYVNQCDIRISLNIKLKNKIINGVMVKINSVI